MDSSSRGGQEGPKYAERARASARASATPPPWRRGAAPQAGERRPQATGGRALDGGDGHGLALLGSAAPTWAAVRRRLAEVEKND